MKNKYTWILVAFVALVVLLGFGLTLNPREIPSPLIGKQVPSFELPRLSPEGQTFSPREMRDKVWMLNVWASWCVTCRQEHPELVKLSKQQIVPIVGLNYKEIQGALDLDFDPRKISPEEERTMAWARAQKWLSTHGDPYTLSIMDLNGRIGMDLGVYGVPETYIIDKTGTIRFKHIGPITAEIVENKILPLIAELNK